MPASIPPKPPGQRRRRNKDQPQWRSVPKVKRKVPPMPGGAKATSSARAYWKTLWSSPMAAMYQEADKFAVARAAVLHALVLRGEAKAAELTELRNLEMALGITPLARRKLQWEVDTAAGEGAATSRQPVDDELAKRRQARRKAATG